MIPAPTLSEIRNHPNKNLKKNRNALCCIVFAPPFSKVASESLVPRVGYLNGRSAEFVDFYCAGYGGYWHPSVVPDMQEIGDIQCESGEVIPWSFSQKMFSGFVNEIERSTRWKYSGEMDLIILDESASFDHCLTFNVARMIDDKAIGRASELFEDIIQYSRSPSIHPTAFEYSDTKAPGLFGRALIGILIEGLKGLRPVWQEGKHFSIRNLNPD